jgi:prepilin-type N-terminal cleavage/methylation domain-containing protein
VTRRPGADRSGRAAREGSGRPHGEDGFSLVELVAALAVFGLLFATVAVGMGSVLNLGRNNRNRSTAAYVAGKELDRVRGVAFDSVALGQTTTAATVSGVSYTITEDVAWVSPSSNSSSCNVPNGSSGAALAYKRVSVRVTWPDMSGVAPVTSQTLLTPPVGAYDPYAGHVAVQLLGRDATPLAGQSVALGGPQTATQVTTADGCAFFAYLTPGAYTVTLATPGYVDRQENQPSSQTVSVAAAQITTVRFDYDQAATLVASFSAPAGAALPGGLPVTVANSNLTLGTKPYPGTGAPRTVTPLFPYASGYQLWAGDCADADPGGYAGGVRGPTLPTDPGGSASAAVALDAVDVLVLRAALPLGGVQLRAVHVGTTGCAAESFTTTAVTDASGRLRVALPYGTWQLEAVGTTKLLSVPTQVTLDPVSTAVPLVTVTVA